MFNGHVTVTKTIKHISNMIDEAVQCVLVVELFPVCDYFLGIQRCVHIFDLEQSHIGNLSNHRYNFHDHSNTHLTSEVHESSARVQQP